MGETKILLFSYGKFYRSGARQNLQNDMQSDQSFFLALWGKPRTQYFFVRVATTLLRLYMSGSSLGTRVIL